MNSVSPLNRKASLWAVGLMLFALFFGAGNLIFPAYLGQQAGGKLVLCDDGFPVDRRGPAAVGRDCHRLFRFARCAGAGIQGCALVRRGVLAVDVAGQTGGPHRYSELTLNQYSVTSP